MDRTAISMFSSNLSFSSSGLSSSTVEHQDIDRFLISPDQFRVHIADIDIEFRQLFCITNDDSWLV